MPHADNLAIHVLATRAFDLLAQARNTDDGMRKIDDLRRLIAGESIFSIQQNVTTTEDAEDQVLLRRFYSSESSSFPIKDGKRKALTAWTECIFIQGRVFIGEGEEALAGSFDDFEQLRKFGLRSVINVPLMSDNLCYGTFNVFGKRSAWTSEEVFGITMLALAATRWVPVAPNLSYRFNSKFMSGSVKE